MISMPGKNAFSKHTELNYMQVITEVAMVDAAAHRLVPPHRQLFYLLPTLGRHAVEVRVLPVLAPSFLPLVSVSSGNEETIFEYDEAMLLNE